MITVSKIVPKHTKDNQPMVVSEFYLTASRELMLVGYCSRCHETVNLVIDLEDLLANCPISTEYSIKDISDLHSLGICLPPDLPLLHPPKSS